MDPAVGALHADAVRCDVLEEIILDGRGGGIDGHSGPTAYELVRSNHDRCRRVEVDAGVGVQIAPRYLDGIAVVDVDAGATGGQLVAAEGDTRGGVQDDTELIPLKAVTFDKAVTAMEQTGPVGGPVIDRVAVDQYLGAVPDEQAHVLVAEVLPGHMGVLDACEYDLPCPQGHGGVLHVDVGVVVDRPTVNGVVR